MKESIALVVVIASYLVFVVLAYLMGHSHGLARGYKDAGITFDTIYAEGAQ